MKYFIIKGSDEVNNLIVELISDVDLYTINQVINHGYYGSGPEKIEDIFDEYSGRDDYFVCFNNLNFDMLYSIPDVYVFDIAKVEGNSYRRPGRFIVNDIKMNLKKVEIIFELPEDEFNSFNKFIEEIKEDTNEEFANLLKDKFIENKYKVKLICIKEIERKSYSKR